MSDQPEAPADPVAVTEDDAIAALVDEYRRLRRAGMAPAEVADCLMYAAAPTAQLPD